MTATCPGQDRDIPLLQALRLQSVTLTYVAVQYEDPITGQCKQPSVVVQPNLNGKPFPVNACLGHFRNLVPYNDHDPTTGQGFCMECEEFHDGARLLRYPVQRYVFALVVKLVHVLKLFKIRWY
jgi:hypothetical protein